ncbi:hypothetical protein JP09_008105 [Dehalogenimonas etheniformans]|uniref:Uncharacterized protein n=1 Tax=Dehalogenimonas etheniformans TaxID=1536648 RepID=A0A2P5P5Y4_9CHLR|nr:hypothetical protein JP09_008105 [Dehalogenimonas etheniformans]
MTGLKTALIILRNNYREVKMSWEQIVIFVVVLWAIVHTIIDMQVKKKVDDLAMKFEEHKH